MDWYIALIYVLVAFDVALGVVIWYLLRLIERRDEVSARPPKREDGASERDRLFGHSVSAEPDPEVEPSSEGAPGGPVGDEGRSGDQE